MHTSGATCGCMLALIAHCNDGLSSATTSSNTTSLTGWSLLLVTVTTSVPLPGSDTGRSEGYHSRGDGHPCSCVHVSSQPTSRIPSRRQYPTPSPLAGFPRRFGGPPG